MDLKQYQKDALRTESVIETVEVNYNTFISTLDLFIQTAKVLDAIKRSIFYKNDERLNNMKTEESLKDLQYSVNAFMENMTCPRDKDVLNINSRALHGIVGISTEAGELAEALMDAILNDGVFDKVNVHEEMHDISWYMAILHDCFELGWVEGLRKNRDKLKARFPDKFTEDNAVNRDLNEERKRLEG